jgi:hypothetical protein
MRWTEYFNTGMPWLFLSGVLGCVVLSLLHLDRGSGVTLGFVCGLTVWPAIIGWMSINGLAILWRLGLACNREGESGATLGLLRIAVPLVTGLGFITGAALLLSAILSHGSRSVPPRQPKVEQAASSDGDKPSN